MKKYKWLFVSLIWITTLYVAYHKISHTNYDVFEVTATNFVDYKTTPLLYPEDSLSFTIHATKDKLQIIEVAFSYDLESLTDEATVRLVITQDSNLLCDQNILLRGFANTIFSTFNISNHTPTSEDYTVTLTNTSPYLSDSFSLYYTDTSNNYLEQLSFYQINEHEYAAQLISRYTYSTGQNWYRIISPLYFSILIGSSLSTLLLFKLKQKTDRNGNN